MSNMRLSTLVLLTLCLMTGSSCNQLATTLTTSPAQRAAKDAPAAPAATSLEQLGRDWLMIISVDLTSSMTQTWVRQQQQQVTPKHEQYSQAQEMARAKAEEMALATPPQTLLLVEAYAGKHIWTVWYGPAGEFKPERATWPTVPRGLGSNHQVAAEKFLQVLHLEPGSVFLVTVSDFIATTAAGEVTAMKYGASTLPENKPFTKLLKSGRVKAWTALR